MTITPRDGLDIAELIYYAPALIIAGIVCWRQGLGKSARSWLILFALAEVRIVGSALLLAASQNPTSPNVSTLLTVAAIMNSFGSSFLIQVIIGILKRVHTGMTVGKSIHPRVFMLVSVPLIVGIILGIVGGVKEMDSDPTSEKLGRNLYQAAVVIFFIVFIITAVGVLFTLTRLDACIPSERKLVVGSTIVLPFLLVRIIYSLSVGFASTTSTLFSLYHPNVYVYSFMAVVEEFIIMGVLLGVALVTPRMAKPSSQDNQSAPPSYNMHHRGKSSGHALLSDRTPPATHQPVYEHSQRNW